MDIAMGHLNPEEIFAVQALAAMWRLGAGRRDSANGSSGNEDSHSEEEKQNDEYSGGSTSSDDIQPDNAEVARNREPDTVDNCYPIEVVHGQQEQEEVVEQDEQDEHEQEQDEPETSDDGNCVPIGEGNAKVPLRILKGADYTMYTKVTRKLLQAVFTRKTLATHSLTGKPSPAFLNRPPKKLLDPLIVDDIVRYVCRRCNVAPNLVRTAITRKCTDEAKLYQKRRRLRRLARQRRNIENIPPPQP
ncbi:hypothetical protein HF086_012421 [Spodoptera exigua]|uniref:BEN domain-containing protein n=1 Tax=Spodoptera exigua TaxID=7107 RepID=A0A922M4F1_SPOEX|nr:hypothetical protein HF086_012421 [Spodoptera exigua]